MVSQLCSSSQQPAEKTARIEQDAYGSVTAFEGYTDLFCLRREDDGMITGGLYKTEE